MATLSLTSQRGVLRDRNGAACSGLLLGEAPPAGTTEMVWVPVVTWVFCTGLGRDTGYVWGTSQPCLCSLPPTFVPSKQNGVTLSCPQASQRKG